MPQNTTSHTPGPWWATVGNRGTLCVLSGDAWICGELSNGNGEAPGEAHANARLIAAAPDLLDTLREAELQITYLHEKFKATGSGETVLFKIHAAIAKAEGR